MSDLFDNLDQRRAIIDRRALSGRLDDIAAEIVGHSARAAAPWLRSATSAATVPRSTAACCWKSR